MSDPLKPLMSELTGGLLKLARGAAEAATLGTVVRETIGAEQRAYMLAQVLLDYEVVVAGSQCPQIVEACHMIASPSPAEAIEQARRRLGAAARVLYLPHPLQTIPGITHPT